MIFLICNLFFGGIRDIAVVEAAFLYDIRFCVRLQTYLGLCIEIDSSNLESQIQDFGSGPIILISIIVITLLNPRTTC